MNPPNPGMNPVREVVLPGPLDASPWHGDWRALAKLIPPPPTNPNFFPAD